MQKQIYAVYDNKAQEIIGGVLYLHAHDAVAVRMFTDAYQAEGTMINKHPEDFELVNLGTVGGNGDERQLQLQSDVRVVLTGAALHQSQQTGDR